MITLEEAKEWLRVEYDEDNNLVQALIDVSVSEIEIATGVTRSYLELKQNETLTNLYKMAQRIIITNLFNEKATEDKALTSFLIQIEAVYRGLILNEN